ncbi:hypothetical protein ACSGR4_001918 [Morganella morganii]
MMRHKEVTDYEINKTVAKYLKLNTIAYDRTEIVLFDDIDATPFDPCNNPADAMPIFIDNKMGVIFLGDLVQISDFSGGTVNFGRNFYRTIAELFLMMKDAENES